MEKEKIREIIEDYYIEETQRLAFIEKDKLDEKYIEWLEKKVAETICKCKSTNITYSCCECGNVF